MAAQPSTGAGAGPASLPTAVLVMLCVLVFMVVAGFVLLTVLGRDTVQYALFIGGPLVTTIVGALLARRSAAVEQLVAQVADTTNGPLRAQFADVHEHLDEQTVELQESAGRIRPAPSRGLPTQDPPAPPRVGLPTSIHQPITGLPVRPSTEI